MKAKLLAVLLLFVQMPPVAAHQQGGSPAPVRGDVYIDPAKPTVYLSVERVEEGRGLWLRLHNNTKLAVRIRISYTEAEQKRTSFVFADGRAGTGLVDGA